MPLAQFGITSGSPTRLRGHLSHEVVLAKLMQVGLLEQLQDSKWGGTVMFTHNVPFDRVSARVFNARLVAERIVLDGLKEWVRKLGFGSFKKVALRSNEKQPIFGQFNWDLSAPSYLHPFVRHREGNSPMPGFFVADVLLGSELSVEQARYFVNKSTIMRRQRNTRPFLSMLVAESFSNEALKLGRNEGLIFTTPDVLFGRGITPTLRSLIQTLENAAAIAVEKPEAIGDIFAKLAAIEGAALNLRGPFFEMIVAHCLHREAPSVDIAVQISDPETGETAEIDVLAKGATLHVCECKGYSRNQVELPEVEHNGWRNAFQGCGGTC